MSQGNVPATHDGVGAGLGAVRLVGLLGEGGMAQVYLGHHETLDRQVAVKRLRPHLASLEQARARMRAEAEIAQAVRHDHIVDVLDLITDTAGDTFLVMEHVAGESLAARLARVGALPLSETLTIAMQIADALDVVHRRGIVHRDLKTENVLVGLDEHGQLQAKLIDFGVAEIVGGRGDGVASNTIIGTPESMSPEQAQAKTIDHRSDIYSFGVLLYEMVAGTPPFVCADLASLVERLVREAPLPPSCQPGAEKQHIPLALESLILECLAKDPADRPPDMSEVALHLELIAADYRTLAHAVDRAMNESARGDRPMKQALLVVDPDADEDELLGQSPSAVRAVGTGDLLHVSAPTPRRPFASVAGSGELVRDARPEEPEDDVAPRARATAAPAAGARAKVLDRRRTEKPRARGKLLRVAGTGLLIAALVGAAGAVGTMALTSGSGSLELPWQR